MRGRGGKEKVGKGGWKGEGRKMRRRNVCVWVGNY